MNTESNTVVNNEIKLNPENKIFIKGFNKNLVCKDFQYEIGKIYDLKDNNKNELELCFNGFHCCPTIDDVIYHGYYPNVSKYCLVEVLGNIIWDDDKYKIVTNRIKIIRELFINEIIDLNDNYNCLYYLIQEKLYVTEFEKELIFDKFLKNNKNPNYSFNCIEHCFYKNKQERKLLFNNFLKLCNIDSELLFDFMVKKLYINKIERNLIFNKILKNNDMDLNKNATLYFFIINKLYNSEKEKSLVFNKYLETCDKNCLDDLKCCNLFETPDELNAIKNRINLLESK